MLYPRLPVKRILFIFSLVVLWVKWKTWMVAKYDHLKRVEQRAMQNKEVE